MIAHVEIPLTQGHVALIDVDDYETVSQFRWCAVKHPPHHRYAMASILKRQRGMHTILTGWKLVDHVDGDGLNNRRSNLRPATHAENMRNRRKQVKSASRFKGVSPSRSRWIALIRGGSSGRRQQYLGTYETEEQAAKAYDAAARELHGEYATLNFPLPHERSAHPHPKDEEQ